MLSSQLYQQAGLSGLMKVNMAAPSPAAAPLFIPAAKGAKWQHGCTPGPPTRGLEPR